MTLYQPIKFEVDMLNTFIESRGQKRNDNMKIMIITGYKCFGMQTQMSPNTFDVWNKAISKFWYQKWSQDSQFNLETKSGWNPTFMFGR